MMNLAIASPSSSPAYSATFIAMQFERLACAMRIHGGPVAEETLPGGPINPVRSARGLVDIAYWCVLKGARWEGPQHAELKRRLRRSKIEVVLANYGQTGVRLLPVCRELGIPLVVHFHGYDAHRKDVIAQYAPAYRELGDLAAALVVVSDAMRKALLELGVSAKRVHLIRYGVDPERFAPKQAFPDRPLFFGVGRFVDKKAPYLTIAAFAEVYRRHPTAKLVLGGDGPLLETCLNLTRALGLEGAVEFVGVLKPDEVAEWMQKATAFVQHSITPAVGPAAGDSEGTPVAMLEALVVGLPVIGTRHAGLGEVIEDGRTGLLVDERDVSGMAAAMLSLCQDTGRARELGRAAREIAMERYTARHYLDSLSEILAAAGRGRPAFTA